MPRTEYDDVKANLIKKSLEKEKMDLYIPVERRKSNDGILNFINLICFLGWEAVIIIITIIIKAGKSIRNISDNDLLWLSKSFWKVDFLKLAFNITVGCSIICAISIILNFTRHRRRTDRIKSSLVWCEIICFVIGAFLILKIY